MTDVGELTVRIRADAAQLQSEMTRANAVVRQSAGGMGTALGGLKAQLLALTPALSAAAFVSFGKHAVDAAGHITDLADRIGFASDTLSALETPLAASGANLDEFSAAINRMNNILGEAAKGNEEAVKAFDQLGLSVTRLRTLSPEDQFYEIAGALGRIKDQSTQTEAGMNLFGRGFASLLPLLKQYDGDMRKAVEAQRLLNSGLSKEALDRVDAFGDALSAAGIKIRNTFLEALAAVLKVADAVTGSGLPANASYDRPATVDAVTRDPAAIDKALRARGLRSSSAAGGNADLLGAKAAKDRAKQITDARQALADYNRSLQEEAALSQLSDRDAAAQEARFKVEEIARKGNITLTREQIEASAELAAKNYDLKKAQDEVNKATQEAARFQQELHDKLSATLTDIAFKAGSAKEAMLGFAESIAKAAFEKKVAGPLADALIGTGGKSGLLDAPLKGLGSLFGGFFADGGKPPPGVPYVVGENGPELRIDGPGMIIPNNKIGGGTTVVVQQTIQLSPGVPELINARIREAAPVIAAQAQAGVFAAIQQGGGASKLVGARS